MSALAPPTCPTCSGTGEIRVGEWIDGAGGSGPVWTDCPNRTCVHRRQEPAPHVDPERLLCELLARHRNAPNPTNGPGRLGILPARVDL